MFPCSINEGDGCVVACQVPDEDVRVEHEQLRDLGLAGRAGLLRHFCGGRGFCYVGLLDIIGF
jgi:hypothetical protein